MMKIKNILLRVISTIIMLLMISCSSDSQPTKVIIEPTVQVQQDTNDIETAAFETSENGRSFIVKYEGMHTRLSDGTYTPYKCPATGVWTVGPGLTSRNIKEGQIYTAGDIAIMFSKRLQRYENYILEQFPDIKFNQNQFDALISFVWNIGSIPSKSGFYKALKSGDFQMAMDKMKLYTKSGGKHLRGLARRRSAEIKLFQKKEQTSKLAIPVKSNDNVCDHK